MKRNKLDIYSSLSIKRIYLLTYLEQLDGILKLFLSLGGLDLLKFVVAPLPPVSCSAQIIVTTFKNACSITL